MYVPTYMPIAGTCVTSDSRVVRDILYDGHPIEERATIITRIAPTFLRLNFYICVILNTLCMYTQLLQIAKRTSSILFNMQTCDVFIYGAYYPNYRRFGSFEIFKARDPMTGRSGPSVGRTDILHQLLDYTTSTFYPEVQQLHANTL